LYLLKKYLNERGLVRATFWLKKDVFENLKQNAHYKHKHNRNITMSKIANDMLTPKTDVETVKIDFTNVNDICEKLPLQDLKDLAEDGFLFPRLYVLDKASKNEVLDIIRRRASERISRQREESY